MSTETPGVSDSEKATVRTLRVTNLTARPLYLRVVVAEELLRDAALPKAAPFTPLEVQHWKTGTMVDGRSGGVWHYDERLEMHHLLSPCAPVSPEPPHADLTDYPLAVLMLRRWARQPLGEVNRIALRDWLTEWGTAEEARVVELTQLHPDFAAFLRQTTRSRRRGYFHLWRDLLVSRFGAFTGWCEGVDEIPF